MAKQKSQVTGKTSYASKHLGQAIPAPHDGGPVKRYQHPTLSGNGEVPAVYPKGVVTRSKRLPGPPDNLA